MELDAAGAAVEAAHGLLERLHREVEPHERDEQALRVCGRVERAVVGGSEGRMAVGLVEAEAERTAGTGGAQERQRALGGLW